jgi:hypothetical protein
MFTVRKYVGILVFRKQNYQPIHYSGNGTAIDEAEDFTFRYTL